MAATIRDLTEADLDWAVDLLVDWDPAITADAYRRTLTGESAAVLRARVAEADGSRLGLSAIVEFEGMRRPMVSVVVDPRHRDAGVGSLLMADTWPHVSAEEVAPDLPGDVRLLAEPAAALPHALAPAVAEFLAEVGDYPEASIYGNTVSNEAVLQMAPDALWLLVVDDVGVLAGTAVEPRPGGEWYVLFTASAPRGRGRGLARAVKQAAHRRAHDAGARAVRTTNEARNERMRALNEAMGYRRVSGDLRLVCRVNSR